MRRHVGEAATTGELKVSLTNNLKAYVDFIEELAAKYTSSRTPQGEVGVLQGQGKNKVNEMLSLSGLRPSGSELRGS